MNAEISQKEESSHVSRGVIAVALNLENSAPQWPFGNVWGQVWSSPLEMGVVGGL